MQVHNIVHYCNRLCHLSLPSHKIMLFYGDLTFYEFPVIMFLNPENKSVHLFCGHHANSKVNGDLFFIFYMKRTNMKLWLNVSYIWDIKRKYLMKSLLAEETHVEQFLHLNIASKCSYLCIPISVVHSSGIQLSL